MLLLVNMGGVQPQKTQTQKGEPMVMLGFLGILGLNTLN